MKSRKISISKSEYQVLLSILEIADWIIHAHYNESERPEMQQFRDFEQKIFSLAGNYGLTEFIVYDEHLEGYFPTQAYEEQSEARSYLDEFENDTFWDQLIERLTFRDFIGKYGEEAIRSMDLKERIQKEDEIREIYEQLFSEKGLDSLRIDFEKNTII